MAVTQTAALAALDAAFADRVRLEFGVMFDGMFTGQKNAPKAIETFRRGIADHLQAHTQAATVIADLIPEKP